MPQILDGNRIRDEIKTECRPRVERLTAHKRPPGLAVVLVGHDPASEIYVRNKVKTSHELGIYSETLTPPADITTETLLAIVEELNRRPEIDGILVQMPLPPQIDAKRVLLAISPEKDVDGLHPCNLGNLATGRPGPRSCTPAGIIELLKRYQIPIAGQRAVVVGRSDMVGKPMALLLLHENATVTMCHSKTHDLPGVCREADILIAAIGRAAMITADYIRSGATVIDVGMNRLDKRADVERLFPAARPGAAAKLDAFARKGTLLVGDVHPIDIVEKAASYTPVPGGVGPLTIAMLMVNTIDSAERRIVVC
jgi:methylenetetrahydrofolate dehydrogenase (NADP+)/methenyltetrahydrofolate cyclohydrolase